MLGNLFTSKKYPQDSSSQFSVVPQTQIPPDLNQNPVSLNTQDIVGSSMKPVVRQDLSIFSHLDSRTAAVLNQAEKETKRIKQEHIEPEQVLIGLTFDGDIFQLLGKFSVDVAALSKELTVKEQVGVFEGNPTFKRYFKTYF
jgi:hypothetical protein